MRPWGYAFTIIGGLAFVAGIIEEYSASRNPPMVAVIVSGLFNPIFFIGFPLGIYWLRRSKKAHPLAVIASGKPGSTVPCEEQGQPCTVNPIASERLAPLAGVNRTEDATPTPKGNRFPLEYDLRAAAAVLAAVLETHADAPPRPSAQRKSGVGSYFRARMMN
jgi:hypothetical protein